MDSCTLPIFSKLVFQEVCRWKSYTAPEKTVLMTNVQDSVFQLFQRVENKHGWMLVVHSSSIPQLDEKLLFSIKVSHALAYVTASKSGVSEPEIEDFISLDDKVEIIKRRPNQRMFLNLKVLDDIYQYHLPPTRRIPPLLWTRV